MDWFCYNLITLIKLCKIPHKNLDKALLSLRDQAFCLKIWKLWWGPTTPQLIFFAETLHMFLIYQCLQKSVQDFFFFLDLELFAIIKKAWFLFTHFFLSLLITQDLYNIKKFRTPFFRYINVCKISAKNIKLYGSWSSLKFSIFQTKKPGFLEIIDLCLNLGIGFCITLLVLLKYKKTNP